MEKKLTKKELEAIQNEKREMRKKFTESVKNYWKDIDAAERYLQTKSEKLTIEEKERLFRKYDALAEYKLQYNDKDSEDYGMWCIARSIVKGQKDCKSWNNEFIDRYFTTKLEEDDLLYDEILWNASQVKLLIREALKYGFKNIYFTNNSSGAMESVGEFIIFGGKVTGTTYNVENQRFGVIINIEDCKLDEQINDNEIIEDITNEFKAKGEELKYDYIARNIEAKLLLKYSKNNNLYALNKLITNIRKEIISNYNI